MAVRDPLNLTPRQREILDLAARDGLSNPAIAARLGLSLSTVKGHLAACRDEIERVMGKRITDGTTSDRWLARIAYILGRLDQDG